MVLPSRCEDNAHCLASVGLGLCLLIHPPPMSATVRDYSPEDLTGVFDLWQRSGSLPVGPDGLTVDQAVQLMGSSSAEALVAVIEGEVVGLVVGTAATPVGTIHRLSLAPELIDSDVADQLIAAIESRLSDKGARKLSSVVGRDDNVRQHLERRGFEIPNGLLYLEHEIPAAVPVRSELIELGGQIIGPGLWDELKGLEDAKEIIERRVILPLAEPKLAQRHSVAPPRAIVLFGPPGTGKTTFAKGIASRLGWPFVELQPAELAAEGAERQAKLLAEAFVRILQLATAVIFVDEVEDIASVRDEERRVSPSVTNEFLKQIPRGGSAASPGVCHQPGRSPRPSLPPSRPLLLRAARGAAGHRGAQGDLGPLRRGDHRRGHRRRGAGRGQRALHPGRYRVRGAQGGAPGVRARALRRVSQPSEHRRLPIRREGNQALSLGGGDRILRGRYPPVR